MCRRLIQDLGIPLVEAPVQGVEIRHNLIELCLEIWLQNMNLPYTVVEGRYGSTSASERFICGFGSGVVMASGRRHDRERSMMALMIHLVHRWKLVEIN